MLTAISSGSAAAVLFSLAFLSLLLGLRLTAGGASRAAVRNLLLELWLAVGLWAVLFMIIGRLLGTAETENLAQEATSLWERICLASAAIKVCCLALGALALAVFALLFRQIARALGQPLLEAKSQEESADE